MRIVLFVTNLERTKAYQAIDVCALIGVGAIPFTEKNKSFFSTF